MTRVLVVDDHTLVRKGLKRLLERDPAITMLAEARDGAEALAVCSGTEFDVVLVDIAMPGVDGFEVLRRLRRDHPKVKAIALSMYPEEQFALRALRAGARGYLSKDRPPQELFAAIASVVQGKLYVSADTAGRLAIDGGPSGGPPHEALSDREFQVLRGLANGLSVSELAAELDLSPKTVSTYRLRAMQKVGLKTNADLIHYAIRHNLVELSER